MLDFRVYSFLAVCKYLSYTRAAQELNLTQPAITQHIQYLQKQYKVKFFTRENNNLRLTPEGEHFHMIMLSINQVEKKLQDDLLHINSAKHIIRFGAAKAFAEYELSRHLAAYVKTHPDREIQLVIQDTPRLFRLLDEGDLHFAIVDDCFPQNKYGTIPWSTEPYICICSNRYLLPEGELQLKDLLSQRLILYTDNSGIPKFFLQFLNSRNILLTDFDSVTEINDLTVIKQLVAEDCGISFLPFKSVEQELAGGLFKKVPLANCDIVQEFTFIWQKDSIYEPLYRLMYGKLHDPEFWLEGLPHD